MSPEPLKLLRYCRNSRLTPMKKCIGTTFLPPRKIVDDDFFRGLISSNTLFQRYEKGPPKEADG